MRGKAVTRQCMFPGMPAPRTRTSLAAEAKFRKRLKNLGAVLLEPRWLGGKQSHRAICAAGHLCSPVPGSVLAGNGICRTCTGHDPAASEARFRQLLTAAGAVLLEPAWLGVACPHRVRCAAGHLCSPRPAGVLSGQGICRPCGIAGRSRDSRSLACEARFRKRLAEAGATLLESTWLGVTTKHRVRCPSGHLCKPAPANVLGGQGICVTCARKDSKVAERRFRARLEELGATLLESTWLGRAEPHRALCASGHPCSPIPRQASAGYGICRTCVGKEPSIAHAKFRVRLAELGATLLEAEWLGVDTPHRVLCAAAHVCHPRPHSVMAGQGPCRFCRGKSWDVFYVVTDPQTQRVKFGITSGDPRPRLRAHRNCGYSETVRLLTGLPGEVGADMERAVKAALSLAGVLPVQGREHFDGDALALVLDVADNYPMTGSTARLAP